MKRNMEDYKHILLAIDLHPDCDKKTAARALKLAHDYKAELSIIHAIEHINAYGVAQAYPTVLNLEEEMLETAKKELAKVSKQLNIPAKRQHVEVGSPKLAILHKAAEIKADLIVVGSHGRHGIALLLGSTANAVLHHAHCDVLAVRVDE